MNLISSMRAAIKEQASKDTDKKEGSNDSQEQRKFEDDPEFRNWQNSKYTQILVDRLLEKADIIERDCSSLSTSPGYDHEQTRISLIVSYTYRTLSEAIQKDLTIPLR